MENNNPPLVSVIIPTYNYGAYIIEAINSVKNQTYKPIEIIVIDDGSTDGTDKIVAPFLKDIIYKKIENKGVSAARNTGIKLSEGEYIAFLDADDYWAPDKIKLQIGCFRAQKDLSVVFSNFNWINESGAIYKRKALKNKYEIFKKYKSKLSDIFIYKIKEKHLRLTFYYGNIFNSLFLGNFINTSSLILKRDLFDRYDIFNETLKTQEDYDLWLRLSLNNLFGFIDKELVNTRIHSTQLTTNVLEVQKVSNMVLTKYSKNAKDMLPEKLFHKRLADKNSNLGLAYLKNNDKKIARKLFLSSLKHCPYKVQFYFFVLLTLFPPPIIKFLHILGKFKIKF
jgi:glycosyltransferase involved in cell wall biosynthesis